MYIDSVYIYAFQLFGGVFRGSQPWEAHTVSLSISLSFDQHCHDSKDMRQDFAETMLPSEEFFPPQIEDVLGSGLIQQCGAVLQDSRKRGPNEPSATILCYTALY